MAQHFSVVQKSANLREKESPGGNEVRRQAQLMQKHIQDLKKRQKFTGFSFSVYCLTMNPDDLQV